MPNGPRRDRIDPGVPPAFGTTPIPEGTVRFNHGTWSQHIPGIQAEGLSRAKSEEMYARGGSESPQVFATAGSPSTFPSEGDRQLVEGWATADQLDLGAPMGRSHMNADQLGAHMRVLEQNRSVITFKGDIPPNQLLGVHKPEHEAARIMMGEGDSAESSIMAGDFDYGDPDDHTFDTAKMALAAKVMVGGKLGGKSFKERGL